MPEQQHKHGHGCVGVELSDVYDGVLWWECSDGVARNAWAGTATRRERIAQRYVDAYNRGSGGAR